MAESWDARVKRLLTLHEGREPFPYVDTVGKITIGCGRNLTDRGLTNHEIDVLYATDYALVCGELDLHVQWWRDCDDVRRAVLFDLCFNLGWPSLSQFARTLAAFKDGRYADAADHLTDSKWHKQVRMRGVRIVAMTRTGTWPADA